MRSCWKSNELNGPIPPHPRAVNISIHSIATSSRLKYFAKIEHSISKIYRVIKSLFKIQIPAELSSLIRISSEFRPFASISAMRWDSLGTPTETGAATEVLDGCKVTDLIKTSSIESRANRSFFDMTRAKEASSFVRQFLKALKTIAVKGKKGKKEGRARRERGRKAGYEWVFRLARSRSAGEFQSSPVSYRTHLLGGWEIYSLVLWPIPRFWSNWGVIDIWSVCTELVMINQLYSTISETFLVGNDPIWAIWNSEKI